MTLRELRWGGADICLREIRLCSWPQAEPPPPPPRHTHTSKEMVVVEVWRDSLVHAGGGNERVTATGEQEREGGDEAV